MIDQITKNKTKYKEGDKIQMNVTNVKKTTDYKLIESKCTYDTTILMVLFSGYLLTSWIV